MDLPDPEPEQDDTLTAALRYAAMGWFIFPTKGRRGADDPTGMEPKEPVVGRWSRDSTTDPEVIVSWYAGDTAGLGIGLDCGKSGLVVADGDRPAEMADWLGEDNLSWAWVLSGNPQRRSWLWRQRPEGPAIGCPIKGVQGGEMKGRGGYVLLPPSFHKIGGSYRWLAQPGDVPGVVPKAVVAKMPTSDAPVVEQATTRQVHEAVAGWDSDDFPEGLEAVLAYLDTELRGSRHDAAFAAICWALDDARAGLYPAESALTEIESRFRTALDEPGRRRPWDSGEWASLVRYAVAKALSKAEKDVQERRRRAIPHAAGIGEGSTAAAPEMDTSGLLLPAEFWSTPQLKTIQTAAWSEQVGAAGVLGAVLARTSMLTNKDVELPRTRNRGSLNLFVGLVASSGGGKGSSVDLAERLLPAKVLSCECGTSGHEGDFITLPPGSGEGLTRSFWELVKEDKGAARWRRDRFHVLLNVDEVEALLAVASRSGSTIGPVLRALWSGGLVGFANASADRRFPLHSGTYRAALVAGVQPGAAGALFAEALGGTPQRFVWLPAHGLDVPDIETGEALPDFPGELPTVQLEARRKSWTGFGITVEETVKREIAVRRNRVARGVELLNPLDAHRDFNRLRVAALLARLHDEREVTEQWWGLAGMVMDLSDATRDRMRESIKREREQRARDAGRADVTRRDVVEGTAAERVESNAATIVRVVAKHTQQGHHGGAGCPPSCAHNAVAGRFTMEAKRAALDWAVAHGMLTESDGRYRPEAE